MMKLLLDENIPFELTQILSKFGHDVKHVYDAGLSGKDDTRIIDYVKNQKRIFITMDLDFANIIHYPPQQHCGIVVVRINKTSKTKLIQIIKTFIQTLDENEIFKALIIVEENKFRIRK